MIRVDKAPEPAKFDEHVRKPGAKFLAGCPAPQRDDWRRGKFWQHARQDLYDSYSRVCAYSSMYIENFDASSVDHYLNKSANPSQAYEWDNLRLANNIVNGYKGDAADVIDPFTVQPGWFVLDFPGCHVRPGTGLQSDDHARVAATIARLKLNSESFVADRVAFGVHLADGEVGLQLLRRRRPFLASEFERQGIVDANSAATVFKRLA